MKGRAQFACFAVGLLAVLGLFASSAEASVSVSMDVSSIKADPFASLPQLTSKPIAERLAAVEQNDAGCVALCELAASIDADPFGYGVKPRPFGGRATPFGRQYFYANANPTMFVDPTGHFTWKAAWETIKGIPRALAEPALQVYDASLVTGANAMDIPADHIQLQSGLGRRQQERIEEGQGGGVSATKGAVENTAATFTFGVSAMLQGYFETGLDFSRGRIGIDQLDDRLTGLGVGLGVMAGGAKVATASRGGAVALEITEGRRGAITGAKGPVIEMVRNADGVYVGAFEGRASQGPVGQIGRSTRALTSEGIGPERQLVGRGATALTREQVARFKGTGYERGTAHNEHLSQWTGGAREVPVETQLGLRVHDVRASTSTATQIALEGKNYLQWRTVNGVRVQGAVPLSKDIRLQGYKDVLWMRDGRRGGVHRISQWDFPGAPPTPELARFLERWGIAYVK